MDKLFQKFAARISRLLGSVWVFLFVLTAIFGAGLFFGFSEAWQRVTSFSTSIATFLILFFLQKSQNVGDKATHAKLDELIRAVGGARNEFTAVEDKHEQEIDRMRETVAEACADDGDQHPGENCEEAIEQFDQAQERAPGRNR